MPRRQRPQSLKHLCLRNMAANMKDVWAKDYTDNYLSEYHFLYLVGPFNDLASDLVQDLLQLLGKTRRLTRAFLHLLLVPHLLELSLRSCSGLVNNTISWIISARCQGLTSLDLHGCSRIQPHALVDLVECLPRLRRLMLSGTQCNGRVLLAVGQGCGDLQELDVSRCREVTPLDLLQLVYDRARAAFRLLRLRRLLAEDTSPLPSPSDYASALAFLLLALPGLEYVANPHLPEALTLICQQHFEKGRDFLRTGGFPGLAELARCGVQAGSPASLSLRRLEVASGHSLCALTSTCRAVEEVVVACDGGLQELWHLGSWERLSRLALECEGFQERLLGDVTPFLAQFGSRLRLLSLINFQLESSLGDVLRLCPNLRVFQAELHPPTGTLKCVPIDEEAEAQQEAEAEADLPSASWTFLHLKDFSVRLADSPLTAASLPRSSQLSLQSALISVLTGSPQLGRLSLVNIPVSLDRVFQPVLERPGSLAQLTELSLAHSVVSSSTIGQLMAADNEMSTLDLRYCQHIHRRHYDRFVKEAAKSNYDLQIHWE
ncbi:uncharacterized protein [Mobula birostris]|uniref:uncharacterized protein n=1 Tax=Mobula birostris TaxID=1983395 RepID=UPI003B287002